MFKQLNRNCHQISTNIHLGRSTIECKWINWQNLICIVTQNRFSEINLMRIQWYDNQNFRIFFILQSNAYNDQIYSVILYCKRIINKEKLKRTCIGEIETKITLYLSLWSLLLRMWKIACYLTLLILPCPCPFSELRLWYQVDAYMGWMFQEHEELFQESMSNLKPDSMTHAHTPSVLNNEQEGWPEQLQEVVLWPWIETNNPH